jgi:flagellar protein FlbT
MALILDLRKGESLLINGAELRFSGGTKVELRGPARFLVGKQVMFPHEATTPARRLYLTIQSAYVGPPNQRSSAVESARKLIEACQQATPPSTIRVALNRILALVHADECYLALKLVRGLIQYEDGIGRSDSQQWSDGGQNGETLAGGSQSSGPIYPISSRVESTCA